MKKVDKVGRYKIEKEIGKGAMGIVFKGIDEELERPIAAKMLSKHLFYDESQEIRFKQEAKIVAKLDHNNIMKVYSIEHAEDTTWIIMELLDGNLLSDLIKQNGFISIEKSIDLIDQMKNALGYAHHQGIIHRDIKPSNVMITNDNVVKLMDFGIARDNKSDVNLTHSGTIIGTPKYMAPEQFQGKDIDHRADVYSLGVVSYEMLYGKAPFKATNIMEFAYKHMNEKPKNISKLVPGIPNDLSKFVMSCLNKNKVSRPNSLNEVRFCPYEAETINLKAPIVSAKKSILKYIFFIILIFGILYYSFYTIKLIPDSLQEKINKVYLYLNSKLGAKDTNLHVGADSKSAEDVGASLVGAQKKDAVKTDSQPTQDLGADSKSAEDVGVSLVGGQKKDVVKTDSQPTQDVATVQAITQKEDPILQKELNKLKDYELISDKTLLFPESKKKNVDTDSKSTPDVGADSKFVQKKEKVVADSKSAQKEDVEADSKLIQKKEEDRLLQEELKKLREARTKLKKEIKLLKEEKNVREDSKPISDVVVDSKPTPDVGANSKSAQKKDVEADSKHTQKKEEDKLLQEELKKLREAQAKLREEVKALKDSKSQVTSHKSQVGAGLASAQDKKSVETDFKPAKKNVVKKSDSSKPVSLDEVPITKIKEETKQTIEKDDGIKDFKITKIEDIEKKDKKLIKELEKTKLSPEDQKIIDEISSNDYKRIRLQVRKLIRQKNYKQLYFDEIVKVIKDYLKNPVNAKLEIDTLSWCIIALGYSNNYSYVPILSKTANSKVHKKISDHAQKSILLIKRHAKPGSKSESIISEPKDVILEKLKSRNYNQIRYAVKVIAKKQNYKKEYLDELKNIIERYIVYPVVSKFSIDALSWCCIIYTRAKDSSYKKLLRSLSRANVHPKIKKHALNAYKSL